MSNKTKNNKHQFLWMAAAALAMVFCFVMIWGFTSDWGNVKVSRMKFAYSESTGESGSYEGSYLLYRPLSATNETPGELIVLFHGGTSNAFAVKNYAIEYARRGYVVLTADLPGTGYSDNIGASTSNDGKKLFLKALQEHIESWNFIKQDHLSAVGFSNGSSTAATLIGMYPDVYVSYANVTNYKLAEAENAAGLGIHYWGIQPYGAVDHTKSSSGAKPRTEEYYNGGLEIMENSVCYYTTAGYVHVLVPDSTEMVAAAVRLQEMAVPTNTTLKYDQLVFWYAEIFAAIGLIMMIVFIVNLCGFLTETEFFSSLVNDPRPVLAAAPQNKKQKLTAVALLIVEFLIFTTAYKLMGGKVVIPTTAFTPIWINNLMPYLLLLAAYQIGKFLFWHYKGRKNAPGSWVDYGIASPGGTKATAINIGKAFIMALIVFVLVIGLIDYMNSTLGVNYQFMVFTMSSLTLKKMAAIPAYILLYVIIFFGAHVTGYVCSRTRDYSDSVLGTFLDAIKGAVITIAPILLWCFINFLNWKEALPISGMDVVADRLYGYVLMVFIIAPLHAFLYKKTHNIWPGIFVCAGIMTFMVCANFPLQITYFG